MFAIQLEPQVEKRLEAIAEKTGKSKSFYAQEAILSYIEDIEDVLLAMERSKNPGKTYSAEEVKRELGL